MALSIRASAIICQHFDIQPPKKYKHLNTELLTLHNSEGNEKRQLKEKFGQ